MQEEFFLLPRFSCPLSVFPTLNFFIYHPKSVSINPLTFFIRRGSNSEPGEKMNFGGIMTQSGFPLIETNVYLEQEFAAAGQ